MFALETKLGEFVVLLALKRVGPEWGEQNSHAHALDLSLNLPGETLFRLEQLQHLNSDPVFNYHLHFVKVKVKFLP
jgi:hypothetical protein